MPSGVSAGAGPGLPVFELISGPGRRFDILAEHREEFESGRMFKLTAERI